MLSDAYIEEFRVLMRKKHGVELRKEDAARLAEWLVAYYDALAKG